MADMFFIALLALIVFGPRKLPQLARELGKIFAELRRAKDEFTGQLQREIGTLDHPVSAGIAKQLAEPAGWSKSAIDNA